MNTFYRNVKKRSILFCFLILSFPFLSFSTLKEPYIIGSEILFHLALCVGISFEFFRQISNKANLRLVFCRSNMIYNVLLLGFYLCFHACFYKVSLSFVLTSFSVFFLFILGSNKYKFSFDMLVLAKLIAIFSSAFIILFVCKEKQLIKHDFFGHSHFLAAWLMLFFPLILWASGQMKSKNRLFLLTTAVLILWFNLFYSNSKIIALLSVICLLFYIHFQFFYNYKISFLCFSFFIFCVFLFISSDEIQASFAERLFIWKICLKNIDYVPFFGLGAHKFESFYQSILNGYLISHPELYQANQTVWVEWAHNELIQSFFEYGYPALFLILWLCYSLFSSFLSYYKSKNDKIICFLGVMLVLCFSFFSFPLRIPFVAVSFLGMFLCFLSESTNNNFFIININFVKSKNYILLEIIFLILFFLLVLVYKEAYALYCFSKGIDTKNINYLEKSYIYNPECKLYSFALGNAFIDEEDYQRAEFYYNKASNIVPAVPQMFSLAQAKELLCKLEQAKDLYEKVRRIDPDFFIKHERLKNINSRLNENG